MPVRRDDAFHVPREKTQAACVGGDPAHQIYVDVDLGPPLARADPLEHPEDIAAQHEDRRVLPGERRLERAVRPTHRRDHRVDPQRPEKSLSLVIDRLSHARTLAFSRARRCFMRRRVYLRQMDERTRIRLTKYSTKAG